MSEFKKFKDYSYNDVLDNNVVFDKSGDYADSEGIEAYNITCTMPHGYKKMISIYPGYRQYLDSIIDSSCNAMHFAVLRMKTGSSIEEHLDDALNFCLFDDSDDSTQSAYYTAVRMLPLHSTVFYMQIPSDLEGGELYVRGDSGLTHYKPQENMKIVIPGNTWHGVTAVTKSNGERCMFVCEQYQLSLRCLRKLQKHGDPIIRKG